MNLLKTPHQRILEEAGASPLSSPGMLNTPKQMLFQEAGVLPKFADGGQAEQNLSPAQMKAALIINGIIPQRFQYAGGGDVKTENDSIDHLDLRHIFNFLQSMGVIK